MEEVYEFFAAIPPVVWGALIALCGVMYGDWRNTRRMDQQNKFAATESDKSRLLTIRKEVYLGAPAALQEMQGKLMDLSGIAERDRSKAAAEPSEILSKIAMVASTETAVLAMRLSTDFGSAQVSLTAKVQPFLDAKADAERFGMAVEQARRDLDRIVSEQQKELESGTPSRERMAALEISRRYAADTHEKFHSQRIHCLEQAEQDFASFLREMVDQTVPLIELGIKLMVRLRWELGQETDEAMYLREMQHGREVFFKSMDSLFTLLKGEAQA